MFTLLNKILSWKALKTLLQRKKLLLQEQMSSAAADVKTSIYGVKG